MVKNGVYKRAAEATSGAADADDLMPMLYEELRRLAAHYLRSESPGHTLQATALVHEAYLQLAESPPTRTIGREHFFAVAATVIRRVLVQHARRRGRLKRGGGRRRLSLDDATCALRQDGVDLLELSDSLDRLRDIDPVKERIVELRFFGGLSVEQVAELLDISPRTVARHWRLARAWLRVELGHDA
jgi:RNA polymerase sigma factor (TIGR02999 family)